MNNKIAFEEFINQHDGLCLIMETYNLDAAEVESVFSKALSDYLFNKVIYNEEESYDE